MAATSTGFRRRRKPLPALVAALAAKFASFRPRLKRISRLTRTMNDPLATGLELMLVGMGTVFVFLTLLVLATAAMSTLIARLAPVPQAEAATGASDDELAAITAALHLHRRRGR
jgi:oxaloacetate decarboxylase gamma subunit